VLEALRIRVGIVQDPSVAGKIGAMAIAGHHLRPYNVHLIGLVPV
jgi:hypothetical protein